jgi:DNA-binding IclR family transcriptional regulator
MHPDGNPPAAGLESASLRAVQRAMRLLFVLAEGQSPRTLQSVADDLGCSVSTVHRIVSTLLPFQLVEHDPGSRGISLGIGTIALADARARHLELSTIARPYMEKLLSTYHETVSLWIRRDRYAVCVASCEGSYELRQYVAVGTLAPLDDMGAKSRVLLASTPPSEAEAIIASCPVHLYAMSIADLVAELETIRRGAAARPSPSGVIYHDVASVATAIHDSSGRIVAALAVAGPSSRFVPTTIDLVETDLHHAAAEISERLGFTRTTRLDDTV